MMAHARAAASRSRNPTTRVGAVVCTYDWRVLSTGYNGNPRGSAYELPTGGPQHHLFVIHAEENALYQAIASLGSNDLSNCLLYSTHRPCAGCVKRAAHLGIPSIIYDLDELDGTQRELAGYVEGSLSISVTRISA